jgi:hypothetical protein
MNGALMRASSRFAIAAALGLVVGVGSARAADLGGNCCADLEERVAELEATTARKGNRKMSLTITGQVNKLMMYFDDGHTRGTYFGLDNTNTSSRLSFLGEAAATPWLKFGFEIMLETEGAGITNRVSAINEDGTFSQLTVNNATNTSTGVNNAGNQDAYFGDARRLAAWVDHKEVGRLTIGRYETAGAMGTIDLGGVGVATGFGTVALLSGNFGLRTTNGNYTGAVWSQFLDPAAYQSRQEVLRYDSPAVHGFIFSTSVSEAAGGYNGGVNWGTMLRYAGEYNGFRIAAGIGYEHIGDTYTPTNASATGAPLLTIAVGGGTTPGSNTFGVSTPNINAWGMALSGLHIPSGLFLQGAYQAVQYNNDTSATTGYWGETCAASTAAGNVIGTAVGPAICNPKKDAWWWQLQGGIAKNYTGFGNTVLYAEYAKMYNFGAEKGPGRDYNSGTLTLANGFTEIAGVRSDIATEWGIGLVQNFDAAATEWYLAYRNTAVELSSTATCVTTTVNTAGPVGVVPNCKISDMNLVYTGLRVKF